MSQVIAYYDKQYERDVTYQERCHQLEDALSRMGFYLCHNNQKELANTWNHVAKPLLMEPDKHKEGS